MNKEKIIEKIFEAQNPNGCWKMLDENHKYYPTYMHYVPNFRATLWVLIYLADLELDRDDERIKQALETIKDHFFDEEKRIYSLKEDHFPIPCLNGNLIYLDAYFNDKIDARTYELIDFFNEYQRFDDGHYKFGANEYCTNKSCYGKHTCYWGVVKLAKGLSFIPYKKRNKAAKELLYKCFDFILRHYVCFSSRREDKIMIRGIDKLTFPNMYRSDMLEILWILARERVKSESVKKAVELLKSKQLDSGEWPLEKKVGNLIVSAGQVGKANQFITKRAEEVLEVYDKNKG